MIQIDHDRARKVFDTLIQVLRGHHYPFEDGINVPQQESNMPRRLEQGSRAHALFLFWVCYYMRGAIKSDVAFIAMSKLYDADPNFFEPRLVRQRTIRGIQRSLSSVRLNFGITQVPHFLRRNAEKLHRHWQSNPLELFRRAKSYDELVALMKHGGRQSITQFLSAPQGFYGFREKMVSMLAYFLQDAGLIKDSKFPVPVDFHVLRMLFSNEILVSNVGVIQPALASVWAREVTEWYCHEADITMRELCNALWIYSRQVCSHAPANGSQIGSYHGRKTQVEPEDLHWGRGQKDRHGRSCKFCPLVMTCRYGIPSGDYYQKGVIKLRDRDQRVPAQRDLAFLIG